MTARERLRRIRAAEESRIFPIVKSNPLISIWPAAAVAVLVLAMVSMALFCSYGKQDSEPQVVQEGQKDPPKIAPKVAWALPEVSGLFRCSAPSSGVWSPLAAGAACSAGDLVQAAHGSGGGEMRVFAQHRIKLFPGTMICLGENPARPRVDLWRGKLEVWAKSAGLELCALGENRSSKYMLTLKAGDHATLYTDAAEDATFTQSGFELTNTAELKPLHCKVMRGLEEPFEKPIAQFEDGTAKLLKVIVCQYRQQSLSEIIRSLRDTLNIQISIKDEKGQGGKFVTLELGEVTSAEVLSKLAEQVGLGLIVRDGEIILELPGKKPGAALPQSADVEF
ncbi:MAG: hypothetical protein V1899_01880 [Planctomycetota bacterium]